jgi:hypothetical protein
MVGVERRCLRCVHSDERRGRRAYFLAGLLLDHDQDQVRGQNKLIRDGRVGHNDPNSLMFDKLQTFIVNECEYVTFFHKLGVSQYRPHGLIQWIMCGISSWEGLACYPSDMLGHIQIVCQFYSMSRLDLENLVFAIAVESSPLDMSVDLLFIRPVKYNTCICM